MNQPVSRAADTPASARGSRWLGFLLKAGLAAALIYWMARSGKLDFRQAAAAASHWPLLLAAAVLSYIGIQIMSMRWNVLLRSQDIRISNWEAFSLSMIGILFSTMIPGSVSGDVVKAYYTADRAPGKKGRAVTTILVDRVVGLVTLLAVSSIAGIWKLPVILRSHTAFIFYLTVVAATIGGSLVLLAAILLSGHTLRLVENFAERFRWLGFLTHPLHALEVFRTRPAPLVWAMLLSVPAQVAACLAFFSCGKALGSSALSVTDSVLVVPLGFTAMALPLAPAGIGVGQMAFYSLFELLLGAPGTAGSSISLVFQVVYLAVAATGLVFYLLHRK
jgi:glycosyltransferase 2 family protein